MCDEYMYVELRYEYYWVRVHQVVVRVLRSSSTSNCRMSTTEYEYIKLWYEYYGVRVHRIVVRVLGSKSTSSCGTSTTEYEYIVLWYEYYGVRVHRVVVRVLRRTSTSSCGTSTTEYEYIKLWYENGWRRTAVRNSGVSWCENSFTEASQRSAKWMRSLLKTSHGKPFESIATMFN